MFNGHTLSVGDDEEGSGNSGDGYTTLWMHLRPLNCTLKMVKMANFMFMYILPKF